MIRGLILGALAFGAVFAAERQFEHLEEDIKRYDAMRAMSGDPPLYRQLLTTVGTMLADYGVSRQEEATDLIGGLTRDIARYAAMRSM